MSIFKKSSGLKIEANILVSLVDIHYTIEKGRLFKKKFSFFLLVHYIRRIVKGFIQSLFKKDEYGQNMSVAGLSLSEHSQPLKIEPCRHCIAILAYSVIGIVYSRLQYLSLTNIGVQPSKACFPRLDSLSYGHNPPHIMPVPC